MNILLVYNPKAGNGKAGKYTASVMREFESRGLDVELKETEGPGHGVDLVKGSDLAAYDALVAAGGDGTIFETVNGYYSNPSDKKPPLGILPVGTGNAFVRDMELETGDWETAIRIIGEGKVRPVDVGKFTLRGSDHYFLNIIGIGFVADVNKVAQKLKIFGNLSYSIGVIYKLIPLKDYRVSLDLDGRRIERDNIFIEVSNTRYTSNFLMAPTAETDDGLLDVTLLNRTSRRRMLQSFPKIFTGEHIHMDEVETFQAKRITIDTETPKELTPDGEMFGTSPLEIECLQQDIKVFWR